MPEKPSDEELHKVLFLNLVMMLSATVMQQLGKVVNPITNKTELDLQGAQSSIDMLSMLERKSVGNLDEEEARLLKQTLSAVQMNFVETAATTPKDPEQAASTGSGQAAHSASSGQAASTGSGQAASTGSGQADEAEPGADDTESPDSPAAQDAETDKPDPKDPKYHKSYE